jgi:hypothetical protein
MTRVLVTDSRAWTDTATFRDAVTTGWGGGTAVLVSGACPTDADQITATTWTLTPDLHGGLCAGYPWVWGGEVFLEKERTARERAPSEPVATDPVETTRKQPAPNESCQRCHAPLTKQQARRRPVSMTSASESPVHRPVRVVLPDARAGHCHVDWGS